MKTFSRHVVKFGGFFCAVPVMAVYFGFKGLSAKNGPSGHPPGEMPLNRKIAKNYFFRQKIEKIMKKSLEIKNNCLPLYRVKETTRRPGPVPGTKNKQLWQR